jgi:hypothetical protein
MTSNKLIRDDNLMEQSILLCAELDIAGEAIYQGLRRYESTDGTYYLADADTFYCLYQTSIGLERLIKVAHRLLRITDASFKHTTGHNLITLHSTTPDIDAGAEEQELLVILDEFYDKKARYSHLDKTPESKLPELRDRLRKLDVVNLVTLMTHKYYALISELSREIGIFTYELRYGSNSAKIFYKVSVNAEQRAYREFIIALVSAHKQRLSHTGKALINLEPIADIYESYELFETIRELGKGAVPQDLIDLVDTYYDELGPAEREQREGILEKFSASLAEDLLEDNEE